MSEGLHSLIDLSTQAPPSPSLWRDLSFVPSRDLSPLPKNSPSMITVPETMGKQLRAAVKRTAIVSSLQTDYPLTL